MSKHTKPNLRLPLVTLSLSMLLSVCSAFADEKCLDVLDSLHVSVLTAQPNSKEEVIFSANITPDDCDREIKYDTTWSVDNQVIQDTNVFQNLFGRHLSPGNHLITLEVFEKRPSCLFLKPPCDVYQSDPKFVVEIKLNVADGCVDGIAKQLLDTDTGTIQEEQNRQLDFGSLFAKPVLLRVHTQKDGSLAYEYGVDYTSGFLEPGRASSPGKYLLSNTCQPLRASANLCLPAAYRAYMQSLGNFENLYINPEIETLNVKGKSFYEMTAYFDFYSARCFHRIRMESNCENIKIQKPVGENCSG